MDKNEKGKAIEPVDVVLKNDPAKEGDSIRISSEVIGVIVSLVSSEVPGIAGMSGGLVGGIAEKLGRRDLTRGIKVQVNEDKVVIDMNVIAEYGTSIVDATNKLKKEVRASVEKTTGLTVETININVQGINVPSAEGETEEEPEKEKQD